MKAGDRVSFVDETVSSIRGVLGTIEHAGGYFRVRFDDGDVGRFSRVMAGEVLTVVTGDDAIPRHVWRLEKRDLAARAPLPVTPASAEFAAPPRSELVDVVICRTCQVEQTDENENEPCRARA
jgi:hypothetical protein